MNIQAANKRLNQLYIMVRRTKTSLKKNEEGLTPGQKKFIMDKLREVATLIK